MAKILALIIKSLLNRKPNTRKQKHKKQMIDLFGRKRYYLAWWFGQWVLFCRNKRDYTLYDPKPYHKFYVEQNVALRYAEKLKTKYKHVTITKVYDSKHHAIGYMLNGFVKLELPDNVVKLKKVVTK